MASSLDDILQARAKAKNDEERRKRRRRLLALMAAAEGGSGLHGSQINLSGTRALAEDFASGGVVGTLSVSGATGTPSWTIDSDPDSKFALDGDNLETGAALDYDVSSSHLVTISVTGMTPAPAARLFTITVTNINEAPTVANVIPDQPADENIPFSFQFASNTFADVDAGTVLTYSATQGDDSPLPAWITFTAATRTFSGTPLLADVGTLSVKVTASDGALSVSDTFDIVIVPAVPGLGPPPESSFDDELHSQLIAVILDDF
jgi:hypothetical protein